MLLLKIFLEGLLRGGSKWGVGEPGQRILHLLQSSNVHCANFYDSFCLAMGDLYSNFCCCTDCGNIIGHFLDKHRKVESLCSSCRAVHLRKSTVVQTAGPGYSGKLTLEESFWNDFLATPSERDSTFDAKGQPKIVPSAAASAAAAAEASGPQGDEVIGKVVDLFGKKEKKEKKEKKSKRKARTTKKGGKKGVVAAEEEPAAADAAAAQEKVDEPSSSSSSSAAAAAPPPQKKKVRTQQEQIDHEALQRSKLGARRFIENFLVRYTDEVLFPIGLTSREFGEVEDRLVYHLSELTNSESFRLPITEEQLTEDQDLLLFFDPENSTRVALMNVLLRSERNLNQDRSEKEEPIVLYRISTSLGKRLYLATKLNAFEEKLGQLGENPASLEKLMNYASGEDFQVGVNWEKNEAQFSGYDEHNKRRHLDCLSRVQVVLRRYGRFIGSDSFPTDELLEHPMYKTFSSFFNKILSPDEADVFRVFVLKTIKEMAGFDCVLGFLLVHEKKLCDWVRYDQGALEIVVEDCPIGPLVEKSARDSDLRDLEVQIKECIQEPAIDAKKIKSILGMKKLERVLIPALHHQITNLALVERKNSERFLKRVNDLATKLSSGLKKGGKKEVAFLSAVLPVAVNIILLLSFSSLESPHVPRLVVPAHTDAEQDLGNKAKILLQISLRLLMGASVSTNSWLGDMLTEPSKFTERYLPASKFELPLQGLRWFVYFLIFFFTIFLFFIFFSFTFISFSLSLSLLKNII